MSSSRLLASDNSPHCLGAWCVGFLRLDQSEVRCADSEGLILHIRCLRPVLALSHGNLATIRWHKCRISAFTDVHCPLLLDELRLSLFISTVLCWRFGPFARRLLKALVQGAHVARNYQP